MKYHADRTFVSATCRDGKRPSEGGRQLVEAGCDSIVAMHPCRSRIEAAALFEGASIEASAALHAERAQSIAQQSSTEVEEIVPC